MLYQYQVSQILAKSLNSVYVVAGSNLLRHAYTYLIFKKQQFKIPTIDTVLYTLPDNVSVTL